MTRPENMTAESKGGMINGNSLKLIAVLSMLLDHIGAALLEDLLQIGPGADVFLQPEQGRLCLQIELMLRSAGRLAFPIFCFLLIEGYLHTGSVRKYAIRLAVFALVSEIPYDAAFFNRFMAMEAQNVFFTLLIGLLTVEGMRSAGFGPWGRIGVVVIGCLAAEFLRSDYASMGVLLIVLFYLARTGQISLVVVGSFLVLFSASYLGAACLALLPISLYNGKRGSGGWKYTFYLFYPAHLILLFLFRLLALGIPMA